MRTFAEVCDELDRRRYVTLGLERIQRLLELLDHPERDLRMVQVVGTNGKGTTAVALASALQEAGTTTATYLSPHVLSYTERMMVGGAYVSEDQFAAVMNHVVEVADENNVPASQFELLTAGALLLFSRAGVKWAIMEAGLGARYDATTAAEPGAVVLTNVSLDHTEYLGDNLVDIAKEKLASLTGSGLLVLGDENPDIVEVARRECARAGVRLVEVKSAQNCDPSRPTSPFTRQNVSLGVRAAEELLGRSIATGGFEEVARQVEGTLPARFERYVVDEVPVIVDGGHNPGGLRAALDAIRAIYGGRDLAVVFGVLRDKDIGSMLSALKSEASYLVLARPVSDRAAEPAEVADHFDPTDLNGRPAEVIVDVVEALSRAVGEMKRTDGVVLVTGSLYMGVDLLRGLRES